VRLSTDYLLAQNTFQFFGEINTLKKPDTVGNGQLSCPSSYNLSDANTLISDFPRLITVPPSAIVNGKTCFQPLLPS
jgi:hypothetical protein